MNKKLTYEEWVDMYAAPQDDESFQALKELHGLNADEVIELIEQTRRKEYEFYINGGFDK